jgi:uncharacterized protein (TIGR02284 family)
MASTDEAVTEDLLQTLEDGKNGYEKGADHLESEDPTMASTFRGFATQRATFATQLREMANQYGDDVKQSSSVTGTLHRGWMAIKDSVSGSNPTAVLEGAEQGDDHALKVYGEALKKEISTGLRTLVETQYADIKAAQATVRQLRDSHK